MDESEGWVPVDESTGAAESSGKAESTSGDGEVSGTGGGTFGTEGGSETDASGDSEGGDAGGTASDQQPAAEGSGQGVESPGNTGTVTYEGVTDDSFMDAMETVQSYVAFNNTVSVVMLVALFCIFGALVIGDFVKSLRGR